MLSLFDLFLCNKVSYLPANMRKYKTATNTQTPTRTNTQTPTQTNTPTNTQTPTITQTQTPSQEPIVLSNYLCTNCISSGDTAVVSAPEGALLGRTVFFGDDGQCWSTISISVSASTISYVSIFDTCESCNAQRPTPTTTQTPTTTPTNTQTRTPRVTVTSTPGATPTQTETSTSTPLPTVTPTSTNFESTFESLWRTTVS